MTPSSVAGAWDLHVHAAPSLFPRWGDAMDLGAACAAAGMRGVVLKAHSGSTVAAAAAVGRATAGLTVLGGVTLNRFVGGLNPAAVEACVALGGRVVWLPTVHAENHRRTFGRLGGFPHASGAASDPGSQQGLSLLQEDGRLRPEVKDIVELLHGSATILGTGHASLAEIIALRRYLGEERKRVRLLVNHALFSTLSLTPDQVGDLASPDTWFETCFFTISPLGRAAEPAQVARTILATPQAQWVAASDSGQRDNPPAPEALASFGGALQAAGLPAAVWGRMIRESPEELLTP